MATTAAQRIAMSYGTKPGHAVEVRGRYVHGPVAALPDGSLVLALSDDGKVERHCIDAEGLESSILWSKGGFKSPYAALFVEGKDDRPPRVWLVETDNHRLVWLDPETGDLQHEIGGRGSGLGKLARPRGLTLMPNGTEVCVTDTDNQRLQFFDAATGDALRVMGEGKMRYPIDVEVLPEGDRFVVVGHGGAIALDADGSVIRELDVSCRQYLAHSILYDPRGGLLLITDEFSNRIQIFDATTYELLHVSAAWASSTPDSGSLVPTSLALCGSERGYKGLAWDAAGKCVIISDSKNNRLCFMTPDSPPMVLTVCVDFEDEAPVLNVTNLAGMHIQKMNVVDGSTLSDLMKLVEEQTGTESFILVCEDGKEMRSDEDMLARLAVPAPS